MTMTAKKASVTLGRDTKQTLDYRRRVVAALHHPVLRAAETDTYYAIARTLTAASAFAGLPTAHRQLVELLESEATDVTDPVAGWRWVKTKILAPSFYQRSRDGEDLV